MTRAQPPAAALAVNFVARRRDDDAPAGQDVASPASVAFMAQTAALLIDATPEELLEEAATAMAGPPGLRPALGLGLAMQRDGVALTDRASAAALAAAQPELMLIALAQLTLDALATAAQREALLTAFAAASVAQFHGGALRDVESALAWFDAP